MSFYFDTFSHTKFDLSEMKSRSLCKIEMSKCWFCFPRTWENYQYKQSKFSIYLGVGWKLLWTLVLVEYIGT